MEIDLKELVEKFGTMVSGISHRMIQNKELAKEASQEIWFEVIKFLQFAGSIIVFVSRP